MKKRIDKATVARTAVLAFALLNQIFTMAGSNPLPFSNDEVYTFITGALTAGAALWAWWKNNSFTQPAIEADEKLKELKARK